MIKYLSICKLILLLILIGFSANSYADKAKVYCSNSKGDWKWLVKKNGSKIKAIGYWKRVLLPENYFVEYFELSAGKNDYFYLKSLCIQNFGNEYSIVQPAKMWYDNLLNVHSEWYPFLVDNIYFTKGNFVIFKYITKYLFNPFIQIYDRIYLTDIFEDDGIDHTFLTYDDLKAMCEATYEKCW